METGFNKHAAVAALTKSTHGNLAGYVDVVRDAANREPEFLSHLIAWNERHGAIRDSKVALPIVSLSAQPLRSDKELFENSMAHLAMKNPKELLKGLKFAKPAAVSIKTFAPMVKGYLRGIEGSVGKFDRVALQHRANLKSIYVMFHVKPSARANAILFKGDNPAGSVFDVVAHLKDMSAADAGAAIAKHKIPFLVAAGAMGARMREDGVALAIIQNMTANELVTNSKMLEKFGITKNPVLRAAYREGIAKKVAVSGANVMKTSVAAEAVADDAVREQLKGAQEQQIAKVAIEGNWLVLADKSGSMDRSIEIARYVAAAISNFVKGKVWLVFFDTLPHAYDVTGQDVVAITNATKRITAGGGTSLGVGLDWALSNKLDIDGIALISDGANHQLNLPPVYKKYAEQFGKEPTVYHYHVPGEPNTLGREMEVAGIPMTTIEIPPDIDYYSIPNLVKTMRGNRFSLIDEIMATPLLTLSEAFKSKGE